MADNDLFFLDDDEKNELDLAESEFQKALLEADVFINGHLVEEGTAFLIED